MADAAGVAKRTVYNVFGDKEALFRGVLSVSIQTAETYAARLASIPVETTDIEAVLRKLARDLAQSIVGANVIPLRRLLIAEVRRFPEFAAEYYDRAPGLVMRTLARTFSRLDAAGLLRIPDAELAGEHFAFLTIGASLDRGLFEIEHSSVAGKRALRRADGGVRVFLRAYAPTREGVSDAAARLT